MKRVAICFNGMLRTAEYNAENILHQANKIDGEVDFFIHTWVENTPKPLHSKGKGFITNYAKEIEKCKDFPEGYQRNRKISELTYLYTLPSTSNDVRKDSYSILSNLQDIYNFKFVEIEPYLGSFSKYFSKLYPRAPHHWYSWWKSVQLKSQYEKIYKMKYDCVISTRTDIMFPKDFNIQKDIELVEKNKKTFFATGLAYNNGRRPNDIYFISSSDVMDVASQFCFGTEGVGPDWDIEKNRKIYVSEFIMKHGIDVEEASPWPEPYSIYRDKCIGIGPFDLKKSIELEKYWYRKWTKEKA